MKIYLNIFIYLLTIAPILATPKINYASGDFERLKQILQKYNFPVKLAMPPQTGTYGMLDSKTRTIWINPVVFELRIAEPTLVHEAVHAAQQCAGGDSGQLKPLNLGLEYPKMAYRHFMRYQGDRRHLEAEAYTVQSLPNNIDYTIDLLHKHCHHKN
jgi:hypothetical protein